MKIAYIVELDAYERSGVLNKITAQVQVWNKLGADARLFLISKPPAVHQVNNVISLDKDLYSVHHNSLAKKIGDLIGKKQIYLNKILTSLAVKKMISEYSADIIYYRFGIWFPGQLLRFGKIPVIIELNTNDIDEVIFYGQLTQKIHLATRRKVLSRADGFCSVSDEISRNITPKYVPSIVIGNGVDIVDIQQRAKPTNQRVQLIFVGASDCKWHGVDKIIVLAKYLTQFDFHIVGLEKNKYVLQSNNVFFHGFLGKKMLGELYKKMDIAIGTLALHRKKMEEASPLKVREYVAYGLPVIIGYIDIDLNNEEFILNIGNYEENVVESIDAIVKFIESWKNKVIDLDISRIDMNKKEKQRLKFFSGFVRN